MKFIQQIKPDSTLKAFWSCFILCLLGGFAIIFIVSPLFHISQKFGQGHDGYIELARSLAKGYGYVFEKDGVPVLHRPPLYPFFLVPIATLPLPFQRPALIIFQSILMGFTGCFIFKLAQELFDKAIATLSVILFLLHPWGYWNAKNPMSAVLQSFLYVVFIYVLIVEFKHIFDKNQSNTSSSRSWVNRILAGVIAASLALTHAAMLAVVGTIFVVLFIIAVLKRNRVYIFSVIVSMLVMIMFVCPWTYRNYVVSGRFLPISSGAGLAYFNGNVHYNFIEEHPQQPKESFIAASLRVLEIDAEVSSCIHFMGFKSINHDRISNKKMLTHIKKTPDKFVAKVFLNAIEYYFPFATYPFLAVKTVTIESIIITIYHLFLWGLVLLSLLVRRSNVSRKVLVLVFLIILSYAVWYFPFATFIGHSLYSFGTIPFLTILAATGISGLISLRNNFKKSINL